MHFLQQHTCQAIAVEVVPCSKNILLVNHTIMERTLWGKYLAAREAKTSWEIPVETMKCGWSVAARVAIIAATWVWLLLLLLTASHFSKCEVDASYFSAHTID